MQFRVFGVLAIVASVVIVGLLIWQLVHHDVVSEPPNGPPPASHGPKLVLRDNWTRSETSFGDRGIASSIVGEVENVGDQSASIDSDFVRLPAPGMVYTVAPAFTVLRPGERVCFNLGVPPITPATAFTMSVPAYQPYTGTLPLIQLVRSSGQYFEETDSYSVTVVAASTADSWYQPQVSATLYDSTGRVVRCERSLTGASLIGPDQVVTFSVSFSGRSPPLRGAGPEWRDVREVRAGVFGIPQPAPLPPLPPMVRPLPTWTPNVWPGTPLARLPEPFATPSRAPAVATATSRVATSTPYPTPTPLPLEVADSSRLKIGPEIDLPPDLAIFIVTGCASCDVRRGDLVRVYRDRSGAIRADRLTVGHLGIAVDFAAARLVIGVVSRGGIYLEGPTAPDTQTTIWQSADGGARWSPVMTFDGEATVLGITPLGVVVRQQRPATTGEARPKAELRLAPSGELLPAPSGTTGDPVVQSDGALLWPRPDGTYLHPDGTMLDLGRPIVLIASRVGPDGARAIQWRTTSGSTYVTIVGSDSRPKFTYWSNPRRPIAPVWLSSTSLLIDSPDLPSSIPSLGGAIFGFLPAILDLTTGQARPISLPFGNWGGHNSVVAALVGPFVRVIETESCLNVRDSPGMAGRVLECVADSVLLGDRGETVEVEQDQWRNVTTPGGKIGWANKRYLAR